MLKIKLIIIFFIMFPFTMHRQSLFSKIFGPNDYNECILLGMDGVDNNYAAQVVKDSCREKFPIKKKRIPKMKTVKKMNDKFNVNNLKYEFGN